MLDKSNVFSVSRDAQNLLNSPKRDVSRSLRRLLQQVLDVTPTGQTFLIACYAFDEGHNAQQLRGIELYAIDKAVDVGFYLRGGLLRPLGTIRDDMFRSVQTTYGLTVDLQTASLKELQGLVEFVMELAYSMHEYADKPSVAADFEDYAYRGLPCSIVPDEELWCVAGVDKRGGSGVLEWCYNEADAKYVLEQMQRYPERFSQLKAESWAQAELVRQSQREALAA